MLFRKIIHIITACFILVSTTGFTINVHYCHNQIYDLALFSPAHSCCEPGGHAKCHASGDMDSMNHCADESIVLEPGDDYMESSCTVSLENNHSRDLLLTSIILFNAQDSDAAIATEAPWHKEPPPYRAVVLSQIQSYLI